MSGGAKKSKIEPQIRKGSHLKFFFLLTAVGVAIFSTIFLTVRQNKENEMKNAENPTTDELTANSGEEISKKSSGECERLKYWAVSALRAFWKLFES